MRLVCSLCWLKVCKKKPQDIKPLFQTIETKQESTVQNGLCFILSAS